MPRVIDNGWWWLAVLWVVLAAVALLRGHYEGGFLRLLLAGQSWLLSVSRPPE